MAVELKERHREVLKAVIHDFIMNAEPVGSRTVSKKYNFNLSPATIRNIMADLEEAGYLNQPHTSAGRVPTDLGYRYYVDALMEPKRLTKFEEDRIERRVRALKSEMEELMRETSRILSHLSHCLGVVLAPRVDKTIFKRIEFIHLSGTRILVILVAESGFVQHKVVQIDEVIDQEELGKVSRYLNDLLQGLTLSQVRELIVAKMAEDRALYDQLLRRALKLGQRSFEEEVEGDLYIGGTANIVDQPEFADLKKMRTLFTAFEEKSKLVKILDECLSQGGLTIIIGSEHPFKEMRGFSLVTSPYKYGDYILGALGVMGPTRMEYGKIVSLVDFTAKLVSRLLTEGDV